MATTYGATAKLQQPRARVTRDSIIMAAALLWLERGFDGTTVDDICESAGVSKGSFYFHFNRKEDLLLEMAVATVAESWEEWKTLEGTDRSTVDLARDIVTSLAERSAGGPRDLISRTVAEVFAAGDRWAAIRGDRKDSVAVLESLLERGQERGEIDRELDPTELSGMIVLIILAGMLEWAQSEDGGDLAGLLRRRVDILLRGAGPS